MTQNPDYCPVRDAISPIARDVERFAYLDGAEIIEALRDSPVGLTEILTDTSGKQAAFKRHIGGAVILDHSLTVFDILRHWLESNGHECFWQRFKDEFVPVIADAQIVQMLIREKLAESTEEQNLRWVTGDSLGDALAELQGDAASLHQQLRMIEHELTTLLSPLDSFEAFHDAHYISTKRNSREVAEKWYKKQSGTERNRLKNEAGGREEAIDKIVKGFQNLRASRKRLEKSLLPKKPPTKRSTK